MRANIPFNSLSWLRNIDYRKVIVVVFLLRLIFASTYDIFVTLTGNDIMLPDSRFYSPFGEYIALLLDGYDGPSIYHYSLSRDGASRVDLQRILRCEKGAFPICVNETGVFFYLIGILYYLFGHISIPIRICNICLSIGSAYFIFKIARHQFGDLAANLFLLFALFLPTQFGYSITFSKDFMRTFVFSFIFWIIYGGAIWKQNRAR